MYMRHPQSGPITPVTEQAFEDVWKAKGWEAVSDEEGEAAAVAAVEAQTPGLGNLPQPVDVVAATEGYDALLKDDLIALADDRGLDSTGTKSDIIARLEADDAAVPA